MSMPLWTTLDPRTQLRELGSFCAVAIGKEPGRAYLLRHAFVPQSDFQQSPLVRVNLDDPTTLEEIKVGHLAPVSAMVPHTFAVDRIITVPEWWADRPSMPTASKHILRALAALLCIATVVLGFWSVPVSSFTFLLGGGFFIALRLLLRPRVTGIRIASLSGLQLDERTIAEYALARSAGESPRGLPGLHRVEEARARVDAIREDYGRRELDVVQRIDAPALFDVDAPTTAAFHEALWRFDALEDTAAAGEAESLASAVEVAWAVAVQHAETVGWHHAPEDKRADLRRASKVAHVAVESPNEGERAASLHQLRRLLLEVGLAYLPTLDETPALNAPHREDRP